MSLVRPSRWAGRVLAFFLLAFIGAQFVRPDRTNPPVAAGASLLTKTPPHITALVDRSCRDCHSSETRWPWYSHVAPMSWLVADHVNHGREHFNYSKWSGYTADDQQKFLDG